MFTDRNQILINDSCTDGNIVDSVYEICDAEFNSRPAIHYSFQTVRGKKSWARYFLLYEVWKICVREGFIVSQFHALNIANRIADDWFSAKEKENATV